jgi:hypothetical protein
MGIFDGKASDAEIRHAVARLSGENMALRAVVGLLLRHSPQRDAVLQDLSAVSGALSHNVRDLHPAVRAAIEDTLKTVRHMA